MESFMKRPTVEDVKAFRNKTGAGMMECKKALEYSDGIEELAIWYLKMPQFIHLLIGGEVKKVRRLQKDLKKKRISISDGI